MHQPTPGRIEWRFPLGYRYDVTPFGTERCHPIHYNPNRSRAATTTDDADTSSVVA
jgi:hypothetical protein